MKTPRHREGPDTGEAARFVQALFPTLAGEEWVQVWLADREHMRPKRGTSELEPTWLSRGYRRLDRIPWDELAALNAARVDLYVAAATYRGPKRRRKVDVVRVPGLRVEIDEKDHPGGKTAILQKLSDELPRDLLPSAIVDSGHGIQPWWFFKEPVTITVEEGRCIYVEGIHKGLGKLLGGDHVHDVNRVLRLPGFLNQKVAGKPVPCKFIAFNPDRRFTLEDFAAYWEETAPVPVSVPRVRPEEVPPRWRKMVDEWPDARMVWEGRGDHKDQSGSGKDMTLAWFVYRAQFSREEATAIVKSAPYPLANHPRGRDDEYVARIIGKVFAGKGTRPKIQPENRQFFKTPAWWKSRGLWARLSPRDLKVAPIIVSHQEGESGIVRIRMSRLAEEAGVSVNRVGKSCKKMAALGMIRREPARCGYINLWVNQTPPPEIAVPALTCSASPAQHVSVPADLPIQPSDLQNQPECQPASPPPPQTTSPVQHVSQPGSALPVQHVSSDSQKGVKGGLPDAAQPSGRSRRGFQASPHVSGAKGKVCPKASGAGARGSEVATRPPQVLPSMQLEQELLASGEKLVYRILRDGNRMLVWRGTMAEWLDWTSPEVLRDEARLAEWPRPVRSPEPPPVPVKPAGVAPPPGDGTSQTSPPMGIDGQPVLMPGRRSSGGKLCGAVTRAQHFECGLRAVPGSDRCRRHGGQEKPSS